MQSGSDFFPVAVSQLVVLTIFLHYLWYWEEFSVSLLTPPSWDSRICNLILQLYCVWALNKMRFLNERKDEIVKIRVIIWKKITCFIFLVPQSLNRLLPNLYWETSDYKYMLWSWIPWAYIHYLLAVWPWATYLTSLLLFPYLSTGYNNTMYF